MLFRELALEGLLLVIPQKRGDSRGWFSESFRQDLFQAEVGDVSFVQHNQSFSASKGTVRGLHFQLPPAEQGKLVSCPAGAVRDVVVDIRRSSPTFGSHLTVELTEETGHQLWIPPGFAHGFITEVDNTTIFYQVTSYYSLENDRGILWKDPELAIDWGVEAPSVVSEKDMRQPLLSQAIELFP